mmetsp:Transcript_38305/g.37818  ORF Transcript_38305/g.37818 Transcript_38305/m.37818 type:complete len:83 (-) Transcript_38305:627-875(-)
MAHLVPHNNFSRNGGGGFTNNVPIIIPSRFDAPDVQQEDEPKNNIKRAPRIVGDARIVTRAFSRLRISQACNAYLGMIGLGI